MKSATLGPSMLGLGVSEIIIILVVALVVLGPTKLPQVARQVGKGLREFRRHAADLQNTFDEVARAAEREELERDRAAAAAKLAPENAPIASEPQSLGSGTAASIGDTATPVVEGGAVASLGVIAKTDNKA